MKILLKDVSARRDEWKKFRSSTLGSSDIVTAAGLNRYRSPLDLWAEKTGKVPSMTENDATWLGQQLEPVIAQFFARRTGRKVIKPDCLYVHPQHEWATATPDFMVLPTPDLASGGFVPESSLRVLECKNTSDRFHRHWQDGGVPDAAQLQVHWQMGVLGLKLAFVAGLVGGSTKQFYHPEVEFSQDIFEQCLGITSKFMDCVRRDVPPLAGPGDKKLIDELFVNRAGWCPLPEPEHEELCRKLVAQKKLLSVKNKEVTQCKEDLDAIENQLRVAMSDHLDATCGEFELKLSQTVVKERFQKGYSFWRLSIKGGQDE